MRQAHLFGPADLITVRLRNLQDNVIVREPLEDPFLQDLVDLIGVEAHGLKPDGRAVRFVLKILQGFIDGLASSLIRRLQIRDHNTDPGKIFFIHSNKKI